MSMPTVPMVPLRRSSRLHASAHINDVEAANSTPTTVLPDVDDGTATALLPRVNRAHLALVLRVALISRLCVWLLGVAAHLSSGGSYDRGLDTDSRVHPAPVALLDHVVRVLVEPFAHWDGLHFATIAQVGYEYEKEHAFFPFVPAVMRGAGAVLGTVLPAGWLSAYDAMLVGGFALTNAAFVAAACAFFYLSVAVLGERDSHVQLALRSALLFCLTPAAVFMSALYTESFFALFSFCGLLCLVRGRHVGAALCFAATCAVRSNGSLFVAFFVFKALHALVDSTRPLGSRFVAVVALALCSLASLAPLFAFQYYGYRRYCVETLTPQPYCADRLPNVYAHVQARYWSVGLFAYYELKQVPNFLLAAPVLIASICGVCRYARHDWRRFFTLGLAARIANANIASSSSSSPSSSSSSSSSFADNVRVLPFVYHWAVLLVIALTVLHVQVTTRFMSAVAPLYWFAASVLPAATTGSSSGAAHTASISRAGVAWVVVSIAYAVIGTCLFCAFLPWT